MAAAKEDVGSKEEDKFTMAMQFPAVSETFQDIYDHSFGPFQECLTFIRENKFGAVWSCERERHQKTMKHASEFVSDLVKGFRDKFDELSKLMGVCASPCDCFRKYICGKLSETCQNDMLETSFSKTKEYFDLRITEIEREFAKLEVADFDKGISNTELDEPLHLHHALLCCRLAYDCKDPENPEQCLISYPKPHVLSPLVVSYENSKVPRYVMARYGNVLYVAFRGLDSTLYTIAAGLARPNETWKGKTNSILFEEAQKVPLNYFAQEIIQEKRIIFSGHSTGGSIASLVTVFLMEKLDGQLAREFLKTNLKCITFGLIPVGNEDITKYVESTLGLTDCFCHYVKHDDIIPKLFSCNISKILSKLIELMMHLVQPAAADFLSSLRPFWNDIVRVLSERGQLEFLPAFDIFGEYYILNPSEGKKPTKCAGKDAIAKLSLKPQEISESCTNLLINHRIDRYDNDMRDSMGDEYAARLKDLPCHDKTKKPDDIFPVVKDVHFEKSEGVLVTKITGKDMWFVHEVKMRGVEPLPNGVVEKATNNEKTFSVHVFTNTGSSAEVHLDPGPLVDYQTVNVKVESHFQNSQYPDKGADVTTSIKLYGTTKRQEELACLEPCEVIELAFVKTLLEHRRSEVNEENDKERYSAMTFFRHVFSVAPIESLFHAIALCDRTTVDECCRVLLANEHLLKELHLSQSVCEAATLALKKINIYKSETRNSVEDNQNLTLLEQAKSKMQTFLKSPSPKEFCQNRSLDALKFESLASPQTLLEDGMLSLRRLSMASGNTLAHVTNSEMLETLNCLCKKFKTCNALVNSFVEVHVKVPEKSKKGFNMGQIFSGGAGFGAVISRLPKREAAVLGIVAGVGCAGYEMYQRFYSKKHDASNYAGKLIFLLTSMEKSCTSEKSIAPYYLERRLVEQCEDRDINVFAPVGEIYQRWNKAFHGETLNLVHDEYRWIIARWIKWSLMVHSLRESMAKQTAVGVIGLLNSGKSTLVKSLFGVKTMTGTVQETRTTVPYIYSLDEVEGLDVIDFPGVNDQDESIPGLANLLLRLTRIVVFVVDYKHASSKATVEWLKILEERDVPALICLSFADKLFAEYMWTGHYPEHKEVEEKLVKELKHIQEKLGQPKKVKRDFAFMAFGLDNDSCLNSEEGKEKLVQAGIKDEVDVGRWIAKELQENKQEDLSERLLKFIAEKKSTTLHPSKK